MPDKSAKVAIPDIEREKVKSARTELDKLGILYRLKKKFSLTVSKGKVIKTDPPVGEKVSKKDEITVYVSRLKLLPIIFFLFLIIIIIILIRLFFFIPGRSS